MGAISELYSPWVWSSGLAALFVHNRLTHKSVGTHQITSNRMGPLWKIQWFLHKKTQMRWGIRSHMSDIDEEQKPRLSDYCPVCKELMWNTENIGHICGCDVFDGVDVFFVNRNRHLRKFLQNFRHRLLDPPLHVHRVHTRGHSFAALSWELVWKKCAANRNANDKWTNPCAMIVFSI